MLYLKNLEPVDFDLVLELGDRCHGKKYLTYSQLEGIYGRSLGAGINCSFSCYKSLEENILVGFRLTYAPGKWKPDKWCSVSKWDLPVNQLCYFKSVTVDPEYRKLGIAKELLNSSIEAVKMLGGKGGIAHIWMESPDNAAYNYFSRMGGKLIATHYNRWAEDCINHGYICARCGSTCTCTAAEMLLKF